MSDMSKEELEARKKSANLREVNIRLITDRQTGIQVTTLLSYIRNAISNRSKADIHVKVGYAVDNGDFSFTVNDEEVVDLIPQETLNIN